MVGLWRSACRMTFSRRRILGRSCVPTFRKQLPGTFSIKPNLIKFVYTSCVTKFSPAHESSA